MIDNHESITAKLCAFARAWHSNKARQKVSDDFLAFGMMGKDEYDSVYRFIQQGFGTYPDMFSSADAEEIIKTYIAPIPLARVHFTESRLNAFVEKQEQVQYVICGAGSDTFSFRSNNPDIEIFEIDHPDTQRSKLDKIKALEWNIPKNVHFLPVDFETEKMTEKLIHAGFDIHKKTFFSILGVSYYLTLPIFTTTLSQIGALSTSGSVLVFDYPQKSGTFPRRVSRLEEITENLGEKMQGGFDYDEISRALYTLGFQIDTYLTPQKVQEQYFQNRDDGLRAFENVCLVSAEYTGGFDYE